MSFQGRSLDEREAASIVAGLHSNNNNVIDTLRYGAPVAAAGSSGRGKKRVRDTTLTDNEKRAKKKSSAAMKPKAKKKEPPMDATGLVFAQPELKPSPYFYYTDHSLEQDDDPLTPITAAGSVPTFPAKMHAILTNPELADVVGWAPHGRSWRILKPRDFEIRVLPKYFEHSKFSSFVRQANGWGFRRMSQGYDKNAYYHEYFLRAMPWLCKKMRRPKVAEKKAVDPEMEPDLDAIGLRLPVPDRPPSREVLVLQKTIELGPKARMPVLWDTGTPVAVPNAPAAENVAAVENLPSLNYSTSYGDLKPAALPTDPPPAQVVQVQAPEAVYVPQDAVPAAVNTMLNMGNLQSNHVQQQFSQYNNNMLPPSTMAMSSSHNNSNNTAFNYAAATPSVPQQTFPSLSQHSPINEAPQQGSLASDSHYAAGFMAATAYHSNQIRTMLSSAFAAGMPISEAASMVMPPANVAASQANSANLGSAFNLLQRAASQNNSQFQPATHYEAAVAQAAGHHPNLQRAAPQNIMHFQANPNVAAAARGNFGYNSTGSSSVMTSQPSTLSQHAMQRLQQFQRGDSRPQYSFPPCNM